MNQIEILELKDTDKINQRTSKQYLNRRKKEIVDMKISQLQICSWGGSKKKEYIKLAKPKRPVGQH